MQSSTIVSFARIDADGKKNGATKNYLMPIFQNWGSKIKQRE